MPTSSELGLKPRDLVRQAVPVYSAHVYYTTIVKLNVDSDRGPLLEILEVDGNGTRAKYLEPHSDGHYLIRAGSIKSFHGRYKGFVSVDVDDELVLMHSCLLD